VVSLFIQIRFLDVLDILIVAFLMYQLYMLIRGTVALNIIIGIILIYLFWGGVKVLKMQMLSSILGQVIGVGVIALIIVFQMEIRRFLILIGTRYVTRYRLRLSGIKMDLDTRPRVRIRSILKAVMDLSNSRTGALIVLKKSSNLQIYTQASDVLDANTSSRVIISIFNKQSPLHDGAIIIDGEKIKAARVVLPITDNPELPPEYGLRHKAAIGITEVTDSIVIVVSEETGQISLAEGGVLNVGISHKELFQKLEKEFISF
jgi:uncharacterized protein (TIGR00159 family)